MVGREKRVLLRRYLDQGLSKAAVGRRASLRVPWKTATPPSSYSWTITLART